MMATDALPETNNIHPEDRELIDKLAKLQNIHGQIRNLRVLFPERLLKPTRMALERPSGSSPAQLAAHLKSAATQGSKDIVHFKRDYRGEEMQDLWQKVHAADFPQGMDAWTINYEKLVEANPVRPESTKVQVNGDGDGGVADVPKEDVEAVVKAFKTAHPDIEVESVSAPDALPIDVRVGELSFRVSVKTSDGTQSYQIDEQPNKTPSELAEQVIKSFQHGQNLTNLETVLSMLASYQDLRFQHCHKCGDIFNSDLMYATARKQKTPKTADDKTVEWLPYHPDCLP